MRSMVVVLAVCIAAPAFALWEDFPTVGLLEQASEQGIDALLQYAPCHIYRVQVGVVPGDRSGETVARYAALGLPVYVEDREHGVAITVGDFATYTEAFLVKRWLLSAGYGDGFFVRQFTHDPAPGSGAVGTSVEAFLPLDADGAWVVADGEGLVLPGPVFEATPGEVVLLEEALAETPPSSPEAGALLFELFLKRSVLSTDSVPHGELLARILEGHVAAYESHYWAAALCYADILHYNSPVRDWPGAYGLYYRVYASSSAPTPARIRAAVELCALSLELESAKTAHAEDAFVWAGRLQALDPDGEFARARATASLILMESLHEQSMSSDAAPVFLGLLSEFRARFQQCAREQAFACHLWWTVAMAVGDRDELRGIQSYYRTLPLSDAREWAFWNESGRPFMDPLRDMDVATVSFEDLTESKEAPLSELISAEPLAHEPATPSAGGDRSPEAYGVNTQAVLEEGW